MALTVWVNPASAIIFLAATVLGMTITFIQKINFVRKHVMKLLTGALVFLAISGVPFLLLYTVQNSTFPWTAFRDWEQFQQLSN